MRTLAAPSSGASRGLGTGRVHHKFPEKGFIKKPTRIFTNLLALRSLGRRCPGTHLHTQLSGMVHYHGKWANRTKLAAEYARGLARAWTAVAAPLCVPRRSKALADWIRLAYYWRAMSNRIQDLDSAEPSLRSRILAVGGVTHLTATRYATELRSIEGYLGVRGLQLESLLLEAGTGAVVMQAGNYLRVFHATGELSSYHENTFVAALRRLLLLFQLTGGPVTDIRSTLAPLWRLMRAFHLAVPPEFRAPVPATAAVAVAMWAWVQQEIEFAVTVLMAHHCLLQPAEAQNIRVCDVVLLDPEDAGRAPGVWGIVAVTAPKTRRLPSHTAVQHVLIEDLALADFLGWVLKFRNLWHEALNALQCADLHWQPAGLRGGTEHFLRHRDVQGLRRRGRWTQLATLDRYLQEGVLLLAQRTEEAKRLRHLAHLGAAFFRRQPNPPPPHTRHLQQEVVERGSSLTGRTGARCRGSAHVYWPSSFDWKRGLPSVRLSPYLYLYTKRCSKKHMESV